MRPNFLFLNSEIKEASDISSSYHSLILYEHYREQGLCEDLTDKFLLVRRIDLPLMDYKYDHLRSHIAQSLLPIVGIAARVE